MKAVTTCEVLDQFRAALIAREIVPPDTIIADGRLHRCNAAGARGRGDAAYLLHLDGAPAGGMENWRDGRGWQTWRLDLGRPLSATERDAMQALSQTAGARDYLVNGMQTPRQVIDATNQYRRDEDYLAAFLGEVLAPVPPDELATFQAAEAAIKAVPWDRRLYVKKNDLFMTYLAWCDEHHHKPMNGSRFKVRVLMTLPWAEVQTDGNTVVAMRDRLLAHDVWGTEGKTGVYRYALLSIRGKELRERARYLPPVKAHTGGNDGAF